MAWRSIIGKVQKDTLIAGKLGLGADLFCQCVCEKKDLQSIDGRRAAAIAVFTGAYLGVACNYVYALYPGLARSITSSTAFRNMLSPKLVEARATQGWICTMADNLLHVPMLYLPSYFLAVGTMQGSSISASVEDMRASWWNTLFSCWVFWVPFMGLNFAVVPPAQRVRAVAGANFCWTVTLDYITQKRDVEP